ncbi:hypothetical protein B9Z55_011653 [Caenorhabditis nigoni]|nr:hypothetical protein B9Z55_011653 [Caenorhabditis nigoni]
MFFQYFLLFLMSLTSSKLRSKVFAMLLLIEEVAAASEDTDPLAATRDAETVSPDRADVFVDQTPDNRNRGYAEVMSDQRYHEEKGRVERELADRGKAGELHVTREPEKKKGRWDATEAPESFENLGAASATPSQGSAPRKRLGFASLSAEAATPRAARWDETPAHSTGAADATPSVDKWSSTPAAQTPRRNRWDETPKADLNDGSMTPGWGMETPARGGDVKLFPDRGHLIRLKTSFSLGPDDAKRRRRYPTPRRRPNPIVHPKPPLADPDRSNDPGRSNAKEKVIRNRPVTDEELESLFPPGYKVLVPPTNYIPLR